MGPRDRRELAVSMLELVASSETEGFELGFSRGTSLEKLASSIQGAELRGDKNATITGVSYDSRQVSPGDVFVCVQGFDTDGHLYAQEAEAKGASALIVDRWLGVSLPQVKVDDCRAGMAQAAAVVFDQPSRELSLVGVTGTNGKTTTAYLVEAILKAAGRKSGLISTITGRIGSEEFPLDRTTPEAPDIQRTLRKMVDQDVSAAVMEVSSQGIDLGRVEECHFDALVFTNLSSEHLDYHKTLDDYFAAKSRLFLHADGDPRAVINIDDAYGRILAASVGHLDQHTFSIGEDATIGAKAIKADRTGTSFNLKSPAGELSINLKLSGRYNVYNALGAAGAALALDVPLEAIRTGLEAVDVIPGRFESIDEGQDFMVVVDYAHTPDSLEKVLVAARELAKARVITVFGCGGGRDQAKRPLMGEVAGRLSDVIYLTSDNPRQEEAEEIIAQVARGIDRSMGEYNMVADRREAINAAIKAARSGDIVIIAGKGHEREQIFRNRSITFDDSSVAREALGTLKRVEV